MNVANYVKDQRRPSHCLATVMFRGHPVQDSNTVNLWKTIFKNKFKNNISPAVHLFSLQLCLLQHRWEHS